MIGSYGGIGDQLSSTLIISPRDFRSGDGKGIPKWHMSDLSEGLWLPLREKSEGLDVEREERVRRLTVTVGN